MQGSIPDMFATTAMYLQLQRVYRERAEQDVAAVETHLARILESVGRDTKSVPKADIRAFCKNARNLRCAEFASHRTSCTCVKTLRIELSTLVHVLLSFIAICLLTRLVDFVILLASLHPSVHNVIKRVRG